MAYQKSTIEHPKVPRSGRLYIIYPKGESKNTKECAAVACFSLSPPIPEFLCFFSVFLGMPKLHGPGSGRRAGQVCSRSAAGRPGEEACLRCKSMLFGKHALASVCLSFSFDFCFWLLQTNTKYCEYFAKFIFI